MKRCHACGGFFDAEYCPNDHTHIEGYRPLPVSYVELRGRVAVYEHPDSDATVLGVLTDHGDADGTVGFCVLTPNLRVPVSELKEIPDGSTTP